MADISEKREPTVSVDPADIDAEIQRPVAVSNASKYLYHLPWASAAELFAVIVTIIGATVLVVCIDGKEQWPTSVHVGTVRGRELRMSLITPQTILSITHSIIAFLIGLAVKDGITMAWWRKTLIGGTVKSLDQDYKFGTSLKNALLSGKNINIIAIATIGAAIAAMTQGPLMQRSLNTKLSTVDSTVTLEAQIADRMPAGFTGVNLGGAGYGSASFYTNEFAAVMKQYADKVPILPIISGCNGTCTGVIRAAGFVPNCTVSTVPYNYSSYNSETQNPNNLLDLQTNSSQLPSGSDVFSVVFSDSAYLPNPDSNDQVWMMIQFDLFYTQLQQLDSTNPDGTVTHMDCTGTKTTHSCLLHPAVVEYPVTITTQQANGSAQPAVAEIDTSHDPFTFTPVTYQNLTLAGDQGNGHSATMTVSGLTLALKQLFGTFFTLGPYQNTTIPPLSANAYTPVAATYLNATDAEFVQIGSTCAVQFSDPAADIMRAVNEIALRIALAATNTSTPVQRYAIHQTRPVSRYSAAAAFWAASLAVTVLGVAMIVPAFYGWWQLGRKVSLNPIEMAEAFNAPVLRRPNTIHKDADHLLELVGDRKVKYVPVEREIGEGGVVKKMEMVDVESPTAPAAAAELRRARWVGGWQG